MCRSLYIILPKPGKGHVLLNGSVLDKHFAKAVMHHAGEKLSRRQLGEALAATFKQLYHLLQRVIRHKVNIYNGTFAADCRLSGNIKACRTRNPFFGKLKLAPA